jgi:hypothetical protein
VPDFLLVRADQTVQVVNVKPAARLADPAGGGGPGLAGAAVRGPRLGPRDLTGASPVLLANVRFLAG